jgi:DegV family protein with EDD domain
MTTAIVTDSTAYVPDELAQALNITVVPVQVIVDGASFSEVSEISLVELFTAIRAGAVVTTSRPAVEQFVSVYEDLTSRGVEHIISVHLSKELSGTYEAAVVASGRVNVPVTVIDSRLIGMAFGYAVVSGAELAQQDEHPDVIAAHIIKRCERASITFCVDTLEFLQRGGRIGSVQARVGGALSVKPILAMKNGAVTSQDLVRTSTKAIARLVELSTKQGKNAQLAVHHVLAEETAQMVADQLASVLNVGEISVIAAGAVVGAHTGPGTVAVAICPTL